MAPRTRSMTDVFPQGIRWSTSGTVGGGMVVNRSRTCSDQTGPGDCAPLAISGWNHLGGIINRPVAGTFAWKFQDYVADILLTPANFPHQTIALPYTNVQLATMAAARTNPSRPYVDVPVSILELGDVVSLLRRSGKQRRFGTKTAQMNIEYQFGIAPLVSDIVKLLNAQDQINRRVLELERLRTKRGLRRTVDVWNGSVQTVSNKFCQSAGVTISRPFTAYTTITQKVHCRWKPSVDLSYLSVPGSMRALATRAVLGLTVDFSTAWEMIPWSWLIDWFTDVGTYLKTQRNIVPATLSGVHVMKHTKTDYSCPDYDSGTGIKMTGINFHREDKERQPSFVSPVAHFPFLSGRQVGILASLAVLRS